MIPQYLSRIVSLLECFSMQHSKLGATDIAKKLGIPKASAYRILFGLWKCGWLIRNGETSKYSIGPRVYLLGNLYAGATDLAKVGNTVLGKLNELTRELVFLSVLDNRHSVIIIKKDSNLDFVWTRKLGTIVPAYAAATGKALLSQVPEAELDKLYPEEKLKPFTKKTLRTKTELKLELQQVRETGVAYNPGGYHEEVESIASPIRDATGNVVAAICFSIPIFRMNQDYQARLSTVVKMTASLISYQLGYNSDTNQVHDFKEIRSWWEQGMTS